MRERAIRAIAIYSIFLKCNHEAIRKEIFPYSHAEQEQTCNTVNVDILHIRKVKKSIYSQVKQQGSSRL